MKKKVAKRTLCFIVIFMVLISTVSFIANAEEITPRYNNVDSTTSVASISSTGKLTIKAYAQKDGIYIVL